MIQYIRKQEISGGSSTDLTGVQKEYAFDINTDASQQSSEELPSCRVNYVKVVVEAGNEYNNAAELSITTLQSNANLGDADEYTCFQTIDFLGAVNIAVGNSPTVGSATVYIGYIIK